ncbi:MAG: tetratricopeptide repeat protein [Deltaproteobacteria bacterium]|nr:tetratricopeptide repeat protein [Deltaproteobacteria bacterium]
MKQAIFIMIFLVLTLALANARERLPLAAGICANKARSLFQTGKIRKAVHLLEDFTAKKAGLDKEQVQKRGYNHYYIHFIIGNYYSILAQKEGNKIFSLNAIKSYQDSTRANPFFAAAWLNLAKSQYEAGFFARAAGSFEKGYDTSKTRKPVHLYNAAICYFQARDPEKALSVFRHLIKAHPGKLTLAWKKTLVNILFSLEKYKTALPWLEELAQKSRTGKKKKWQEILLYQYLSLGMDKKALAYANFLTQTDVLEPKWWKALCHIHLGNQDLEKGLSALIIYGYLSPLTREERLLEADLYLSLDIPAKAALIYENVLKSKTDPKTILKLGNACAMAYDPDKALEWINKGLYSFKDKKLLRMKAWLETIQTTSNRQVK